MDSLVQAKVQAKSWIDAILVPTFILIFIKHSKAGIASANENFWLTMWVWDMSIDELVNWSTIQTVVTGKTLFPCESIMCAVLLAIYCDTL